MYRLATCYTNNQTPPSPPIGTSSFPFNCRIIHGEWTGWFQPNIKHYPDRLNWRIFSSSGLNWCKVDPTMQISNMYTITSRIKSSISSNYLIIMDNIHTATNKRGILSQLPSVSNQSHGSRLRRQHWRRSEDALQATGVITRRASEPRRDSSPERRRRSLAGNWWWGSCGRPGGLENGSGEKTHLGVGSDGWELQLTGLIERDRESVGSWARGI